jgi:NAD(P)-dependent dehydrogenase (short-subunit alcohol dehydrogenase family)
MTSTAIITGASKGIGKATAINFLQEGHRVINLSRSPCNVDDVENIAIDLAAPDALQHAGDALSDLEPGVFHLVHNAARLTSESVRNIEIDDFRQTIDINIVAPQILNRLLLPLMQAGSSIIYVGSTLSEKAVPNSFSYVTTKHANVGMMRATCQDLAGSSIHTACVCPGFTNTEMLRAHVGESEDILQSIAAGSTFGRLIEPDEVAEAICFAARNPVINGAIIHANLGQIEN